MTTNSQAPTRSSTRWTSVMLEWERVRVGAVEREAVGPDGEIGTLTDNVIILRRR